MKGSRPLFPRILSLEKHSGDDRFDCITFIWKNTKIWRWKTLGKNMRLL